jgi:hypothetical protein
MHHHGLYDSPHVYIEHHVHSVTGQDDVAATDVVPIKTHPENSTTIGIECMKII